MDFKMITPCGERAVTQIIPVKECSAYGELEDLSYDDWWQTRKNEILKVGGNVINLQGANILMIKMIMTIKINSLH